MSVDAQNALFPIIDHGLPTGTRPIATSTAPAQGRFTVVTSDGRDYLYVPELQELFSISAVLAHVLRGAEVNPLRLCAGESMTDLAQGAYKLVSHLTKTAPKQGLSESRHAHTGLRDVVIHVSQRCNLNCVYCYAVDLNKANKTMSPEVSERVLARTMQLAPDGLASVKFLGGEPTLAWPVIESLMTGYLRESERFAKAPPRFSIVTNGTRMTPKMVASAASHRMYVLVSIDGDQEIHDRLRPTHDMKGTYGKATATLKRLVDAKVDVAVESVYTRQHFQSGITPQMMVDHFLSLGVREFQIAPTVGVWHGSHTIEETEQISSLFADAARNSVRSFRTENPYVLRGIQFVLDGFSLKERRRHVCGAGRTFMGINYDGEAFPCYLLESSEISYGFVDRWDQARYENVRAKFERNGKEHHPVCAQCWANEICQSCLGTSWQISPEITKPPAWFCSFQKSIIAATLGEIAGARQSESWPLFLKNMEAYLRPLSPTAT